MTHGVQSPLLHAPIYPFPGFYRSDLCRESHDWSKNGCGLFFILIVFRSPKWFNISISKADRVSPEWSCLGGWCHVVEGHPGWLRPLKGFLISPWENLDGMGGGESWPPSLACITYWKKVSPAEGFPGGASDKEPACQWRRCKRRGFDPWVGKKPWRRAWHPTPVFLPGESHGQKSLAGYSPWGCQELDTIEAT